MRIVAISDLHGIFPKSIPECDLLIVAGDVCPDRFNGKLAKHAPERQLQWFEDTFVPWAEKQPAEFVVGTWGNHDFCGHLAPNMFYGDKLDMVSDGPMLVNGVKLWLTPWSPTFMDWAWMKPNDELAEIYKAIPEDVDILVSHSPPYGFGDMYPNLHTGKMEHVGSQALLYTIERVMPDVVICGHLHGGHGKYYHGDDWGVFGRTIYNVSILDEQYRLRNPVTEFEYAKDI